jgi:hypothetical protein
LQNDSFPSQIITCRMTDIAWLERAHEQHDGGLAELNTDVLLASLHDDPRFKALGRRINLPD